MDEYEAMIEEFGVVMDDLVALLPEEPATELEAKAAQLVALGVKLVEMLNMEGEGDAEEEEGAEVEVMIDGSEEMA